MANWKELGEVPDSEDEGGFESQNAEEAQFVQLDIATTPSLNRDGEKDIWDFPDSDGENDSMKAQQPDLLGASPSPTPPHCLDPRSPPSVLDVDLDCRTPSQNDRSRKSTPVTEKAASDPVSPCISSHIPRIEVLIGTHASSLAEKSKAPTQVPHTPQSVQEREAHQISVRHERSLRPRKPIQEHPYLLENAQYSTFLRERGVRPLKIAEPGQVRAVNSPQDPEPEQDTQEDYLPEETDESQLRDANDAVEEHDGVLLSSSPTEKSPSKSRAGISSLPNSQETHGTSVMEQDLPDVEQLLNRQSLPQTHRPQSGKRKTSQPQSTARKRQRQEVVDDVWNVDSSPLSLTREMNIDNDLTPTRGPRTERTTSPVWSLDTPPRLQIPVIHVPSEDEGDVLGEDTLAPLEIEDDQSESENDELVTKMGRRIKGVLPASWLRLDQQSSRDKTQQDIHRKKQQQSRPHDREIRRGVAQPRHGVAGSTMTSFPFEESDEDEQIEGGGRANSLEERTTDDVFHRQTRLDFEPQAEEFALSESPPSDGADSAMEEDSIDFIMPGRKRQRRLPETIDGHSKRVKKPVTYDRHSSVKRPRQLQITSLLQKSQGSSSTKNPKSQTRSQNPTMRKPRKNGHVGKANGELRKLRAPLLSILDVIQPDAPSFLRIAARTAQRRPRKGRSSLQGKIIKMATRRDNIDAASVLEDWRSGSIRQRSSVTASCPPSRRHRQPLEPLAERLANTMDGIHSLTQSAIGESKPRKLARSISQGGSASYRQGGSTANLSSQGQTAATGQAFGSRGHPITGPTRPAQLEVAETERPRVLRFHMLKKIFDRLYKEPGQNAPGESSAEILDADLARQSLTESAEPEQPEQRHDVQGQRRLGRRSKHCHRKQRKPRRIDVEAPQYTHADDPLPTEKPASRLTSETQPGGKKLQGLGPYGTVYTHHFEVFPFDPGVYFHESTVIGSGAIDACLGDELLWKMRTARPRISFHLGEQVLRWGPWDDQVSSELGIVFDFVAEQMESSGGEAPPEMRVALDAAGFVFRYIKDAFSLDEDSPVAPFVARLRKILSGFCDRLGPRIKQLGQGQHANSHEWALRSFDWLLLVCFQVLRICQADALLTEEQFRMEEVLRSVAGMLLSILVSLGTGRLTDTYERLAASDYRQRGLRDDVPAFQSWTLAMRILEVARIPRSSFWDLLGEAINVSEAISGVDVGEYERVWETVFQLLPLSEFSNSGIVVAGKRHETATDGWGIPQKLLKRVFELYQADDRQGPSFNNYCRALVGRCHYLLRQWGWRRSAPILGVIFDFFGSQNLAHLRNEEVHRSPNFLEHLATEPSLEVEADDRCFHIFLKLLALSIRELKRFGSDKDIRNLVARTTPNHNRHYLKEQNVHERDLAALRNHHDLIGTLYWACPPKLRPSVTLIERLVSPESSHKEACLINIRAWSQLARFVVASGEATTLPRHLGSWRNSFFTKMLQQLESVAGDIQQQLCSLSRDVSKSVSRDMVDAMISLNKAAVRELLHASMTASLNVMRHAPDLEAASFCLSIPQLQQVFGCFCASTAELDWTMLRTALATLDLFLAKVEDFKDNEGSQQSESQILISAQADDALMAVDNDLARSFFLMARTILSSESSVNLHAVPAMDRQWCVEEILLLAARLGIRFIDGGVMRLSDMFRPGKYGVFTDLPTALDLEQRRYLPLFISNLMRQGFTGFADAKFSLAGVWALSLVKPRRHLEYENRLAEQLQRQGRDFVPEAVVGLSVAPDYNSNRDLFEFAIASMRRTVRDAGPSLKKILIKEHAGMLGSVMAQIKADLKLVVSWGDPEHGDYVGFVQAVISLIKVHAGEICAVDDFFYKISREYSPSKGDPQLQVAGMMSYGLRLQEGDGRMAHQLFYLLLTNFKFAVASNKLDDDVDVLVKGLKQGGIFSFVLGKMLPAVMLASLDREAVLVLLDVYVHALGVHLESSAVGPEIGEGDLSNVAVVLRAMVDVLGRMSGSDVLSWGHMHLLRQAMTVGNFIWPSLYVLSLSRPENACWGEVRGVLQRLGRFAVSAREYVSRLVGEGRRAVEVSMLFRGLAGMRFDAHVVDFARDIVDDVARNWVVSEARVDVQAPGQPRAPGGQGVERPVGDVGEVIGDLHGRMREWLYWAERFGLEAGEEVYEPLFI